MQDTNIDWELCILLVQLLKTVSISFINSELVKALFERGAFKFVVETIIHHYYCMLAKQFIW